MTQSTAMLTLCPGDPMMVLAHSEHTLRRRRGQGSRGGAAPPKSLEFGNETMGWRLAWIVSQLDGDRCIAHGGGFPGYTAFIAFDDQWSRLPVCAWVAAVQAIKCLSWTARGTAGRSVSRR